MIAPLRHAADMDYSALSAQQRRAMRLVKTYKMFRRPGGFGRPPYGVSLDVAKSLIGLGIVRLDYTARQPELVFTGIGVQVYAVMEQRARPRKVHA